MPSTSSHHPDRLRPTSQSPAGPTSRLPGEKRPGTRPHCGPRAPDAPHVLVVGADAATDRRGVAAHTSGLAEHLALTAASVSVLAASSRPQTPSRGNPISPPAGLGLPAASQGGCGTAVVRVRRQPATAEGGWLRAGDELGFLTGALTAALPHVPDVVLGVTPGLGGAVAAARIARRHRAPLILVVHDLLSARRDGTTGRGLTVAAATERRLLRAATEIAVTSPELSEHVYDLGVCPEHVHLLPHWARTGTVRLDRHAARRALGWPTRAFTVVLSADGGTRPDLATVSAAAELLHGEARFVVLGDGTRRSAVPSQPTGPDRVRRFTVADDETYQRALAAADLLLVAERSDATGLPLPGALAPYLAAGRPVLAAVREAGSVAGELARSGGAGLVVRPGEPRTLAAAVRALRLDEPLRQAMGRAAERYAAERLGQADVLCQLDAMLRTALGEAVIDLATPREPAPR